MTSVVDGGRMAYCGRELRTGVTDSTLSVLLHAQLYFTYQVSYISAVHGTDSFRPLRRTRYFDPHVTTHTCGQGDYGHREPLDYIIKVVHSIHIQL